MEYVSENEIHTPQRLNIHNNGDKGACGGRERMSYGTCGMCSASILDTKGVINLSLEIVWKHQKF